MLQYCTKDQLLDTLFKLVHKYCSSFDTKLIPEIPDLIDPCVQAESLEECDAIKLESPFAAFAMFASKQAIVIGIKMTDSDEIQKLGVRNICAELAQRVQFVLSQSAMSGHVTIYGIFYYCSGFIWHYSNGFFF